MVSSIALSASAMCALAADPCQHAPPCSQATPLAGRPPAPSPYHHRAPGMRAQYSPAQQQQQHRSHPAAPPSPASSRLSNIAQRSSASAGPASPARPSPGAGVRSSGFSIRSAASGGSAGSGGSGGSGGAGYDRNADPAELFVRQDRIGACCFLSLSLAVLHEDGRKVRPRRQARREVEAAQAPLAESTLHDERELTLSPFPRRRQGLVRRGVQGLLGQDAESGRDQGCVLARSQAGWPRSCLLGS